MKNGNQVKMSAELMHKLHKELSANLGSGSRGVQRPIKLQVPEYLSTNSFQLLSDQHIFGGAAKLAATPKYLLLYSYPSLPRATSYTSLLQLDTIHGCNIVFPVVKRHCWLSPFIV